jgi:hypothetical protein
MTFLQPVLLWGLLGVLIPVIIHFWYQKKGKTIAWAAMQWLTDKTSLQHRGIRLDEIPLLLLRILLITLLTLILSKAAIAWFENQAIAKRVHLVEPNKVVTDTYKFELQDALKKGEQVFWIDNESNSLTNADDTPASSSGLQYLQQSINAASGKGSELVLYILNTPSNSLQSKVIVPTAFKLMMAVDSTRDQAVNYLAIDGSTGLFVDKSTGALKLDESGKYPGASAVGKSPIRILLDYKNPTEKQTVKAALQALAEVYKFPFEITETAEDQTKYDWIFTNDMVENSEGQTMYIISGHAYSGAIPAGVVSVKDSLTITSSQMVQEGKLPEWLGEQFVGRYNLGLETGRVSDKQLRAMFVTTDRSEQQSSDRFGKFLLLGFVMTLLVERWMSLKKNGTQTYA